MLRIEGLCASYGERLVLENVSMEVGKNEIVSLIGANGAGKSTVLKTIMGLLKPTSGSILLDGDGIGGRPVNSIVRSGISLCPEGRRVFGNMTIRENLEMGAYVRKGSISSDIEHIIELFPVLGERINQPARVLSGGEQQMLAIGRALMAKPRLLLLDEPSMGLAPIMVDKIFDVIKSIWMQGMSILLVEQNAAMALDTCQRAYVIETGKIALQGSANELRANKMVSSVFLGRGE